MDESVCYHFATVKQRRENRHEIEYQLILRQQPKQSRMCGVGEKADRRPIDPPPIVQLKVIDPSLPPLERNSYLQNPYYFMYASLMAADLDEELHLLKDGRTRSTTGSVVSSLYHLKDIDNTDAGFFVFPDLSVRMEGSYRLKLSLFEIIGKDVFHCRSIISNTFFVYSAKKFPGMEESTFLSRSFADQGLKIRIRKELRQRRKLKNTVEESNENSANETNEQNNESIGSNTTTIVTVNSNNSTPSLPMAIAASASTSSGTKIGKRAKISKDSLPITPISVTTPAQYRHDLLPVPTRYISYNGKQPDIRPLAPMSGSIPNMQRYSQQEDGNNNNDNVVTDSTTTSGAQIPMIEGRRQYQQPQALQPYQSYFPIEIPPIQGNRNMEHGYQNDAYYHSHEASPNPSAIHSFHYNNSLRQPVYYYQSNYPLPSPYTSNSSFPLLLPHHQQLYTQPPPPPPLPPPPLPSSHSSFSLLPPPPPHPPLLHESSSSSSYVQKSPSKY